MLLAQKMLDGKQFGSIAETMRFPIVRYHLTILLMNKKQSSTLFVLLFCKGFTSKKERGEEMKKAFVFDVDDTIYDQQNAFKRAFDKQFSAYNDVVDDVDLYKLMKEYGDESFASTGFDSGKLRRMQIHRIKRALEDYDIKITDKQALRFQLDFENFQNDISLFPFMKSIFDELTRAGVPLGIITNGTIKKQSKKIEQLGLNNWFPEENIIISEEIGVSKPKRKIFENFEETLKLPSEEIFYIGDNFLNDIVGPKSLGWKTIWVNYRSQRLIDKSIVPDYSVFSPVELYKTIMELI